MKNLLAWVNKYIRSIYNIFLLLTVLFFFYNYFFHYDGANQFGQLALEGWPVMEQSETPQACSLDGLPPDILSRAKQICGGGGHSLLLDHDGCVWACGHNNRGQCAVPVADDVKCVRPWIKVQLGVHRIIEVAAGWEHSVALDGEGNLLAWGSNSHGQIGQVAERGKWSHEPLQLAEGVKSVSAGLRQTTWITKQNTIISCGSNGQEKRDVPLILNPFKVASGQKHNFILVGNNESDEPTGKIYGWGDNKFWQLAADPQQVPKTDNLIPAELLQDFELTDLKSGWSHGAALTTTGQVICWGRSNYGQLGSPEPRNLYLWPPLQGDSKAKEIDLGSEHTMVLTESGDLWTCGWNEHGNCGNGNLEDQHVPSVILRGASLIGCGASHCFAIVDSG